MPPIPVSAWRHPHVPYFSVVPRLFRQTCRSCLRSIFFYIACTSCCRNNLVTFGAHFGQPCRRERLFGSLNANNSGKAFLGGPGRARELCPLHQHPTCQKKRRRRNWRRWGGSKFQGDGRGKAARPNVANGNGKTRPTPFLVTTKFTLCLKENMK